MYVDTVPEKAVTFEAWRGLTGDSTSKTFQHRLMCPVLSIRTELYTASFT